MTISFGYDAKIVRMADVSDDSIRKCVEKILSERDPTDWLTIGYAEGTTDKFVLTASGTGGISELTKTLSPTFKGYAYARIQTKAAPAKFVLIQFVGSACTAFEKARVIVHDEDVHSVLKPFNAKISASCLEDLSESKIAESLGK